MRALMHGNCHRAAEACRYSHGFDAGAPDIEEVGEDLPDLEEVDEVD